MLSLLGKEQFGHSAKYLFLYSTEKKENHISLEQHQGLQVRLSDSYIESAAVIMCFCLHYPGYLDKNPIGLFF